MELKRSNFLVQLAMFGAPDYYGEITNLCQLFWRCVRGLLFSAFIAGICSVLLLGLVVLPIVNLIVWLQYGQYAEMGAVTHVALVIWGALFAIGLFVAAGMAADYYGVIRGFSQLSAVQLTAEAYRGFKDRFCPTLTIKE